MTGSQVGQMLRDQIEAEARAAGRQLQGDLQDVAEFAAEQVEHLQRIQGEAGYDEAVQAAALTVALRAGGSAVDAADSVDRVLYGIAAGALRVGAMAIAAA